MKNIPMLDLKLEYDFMKKDIDSAIKKCLEHQKWILGPEVRELESNISEYLKVKHCIGVSSGTEALVLSLRALAIKLKGQEYFDRTDEIITTPFTFTATGDAILRSGATPLFIDIDPMTYNLDPNKIRSYLTDSSTHQLNSSSKVVGILPVHLYGQSCHMDEIMHIAKEHNLFVVEDVAQGFGGMWKGKKLGSIGNTGTLSFFPSKNLGGFGDGGMVSTNDDEIAELVRMLLRHGGKDKYNVDHIGYNARLDTLQGAIILAKFKYIDEFNEKRREIAKIYSGELSGIDDITLPVNKPSAHPPNDSTTEPPHHSTTPLPDGHVFHQYTTSVSNEKRDELQKYMKEKGISTMVYYPFPLHKMNVFGDGRSESYGSLENAEQATLSVLSLPIEPLQSMEETSYVIECIKSFFKT